MKNKRFFWNFFNSSGFYIWLLFLCSIIISFYDFKTGFLVFALSIICLVFGIISDSARRKGIKTFLNSITDNMHSDIHSILGGNLIPLAIIRHDGVIVWSNEGFSAIVETKNTRKAHITELISEFSLSDCLNTDQGKFYHVTHCNKNYLVDVASSRTDNELYYALHFKDCTEYETLKAKYNNEKTVCALIVVDNYDDVMIDVANSDKPKVSAAIEETLSLWAQSVDGVLKKIEKDRFLFYFSNKGLGKFVEQRFDILEKIKEIAVGNRLSPTLSIGIGRYGETLSSTESYAYAALDMALGRGGDQAVIKQDEEDYRFFGGKSPETEKRTKVKARVVAEAIRQQLLEKDDIIIMGHKYADSDSFGACIGLCKAVRAMNKSCKIVLEKYNNTVRKMIENFKDDEYDDLFINKAYANEIVNKNSLIFVVDTHVKSMVEEPSLLDVTPNIIVIDHHRRNAGFIQNPLISYHEPYASSASELVTEIIHYLGERVRLSKKEAEALYAGIYLDTKNFTYKTGVRTFEAASYLKALGVDTISIKKLFQIDANTFNKKWQIMDGAYTYKHSISIAKCEKNDVDMQTIVAQAADELLSISDIVCSFVLCDMGDSIIISARSLGTYNIQIIMEKLGGGGHITSAATRLEGVSLDTAEEMLIGAIDEYFNENKI